MQKITIIGHLEEDAIISSANGKDLLTFNVCVTESYKNNAGERVEESTWYSCIYHSTGLCAYLKKGNCIGVSGSLKAKIYTKDGKSNLDLSIQVNEIKLIGSKKD